MAVPTFLRWASVQHDGKARKKAIDLAGHRHQAVMHYLSITEIVEMAARA